MGGKQAGHPLGVFQSESEQPRRNLGSFTGNALASGVISALVAGVIAFFVASYQVHSADRQAIAGEQAQAAAQLQAAARTLYDAASAVRPFDSTCKGSADGLNLLCTYRVDPAGTPPIKNDLEIYGTDQANVSDPVVSRLAAQLLIAAESFMHATTSEEFQDYGQLQDAYDALIARCGQIVKGQT